MAVNEFISLPFVTGGEGNVEVQLPGRKSSLHSTRDCSRNYTLASFCLHVRGLVCTRCNELNRGHFHFRVLQSVPKLKTALR
jgi:hypothetical protein